MEFNANKQKGGLNESSNYVRGKSIDGEWVRGDLVQKKSSISICVCIDLKSATIFVNC